MTAAQLEAGYRRAYREFYGWPAIVRSPWTEDEARDRLRHLAYTAGWKKMDPLWDIAIRHGRAQRLLLAPTACAALASWRRLLLAALALSVSIELGQHAVSLLVGYSYRATEVDDVILNAPGVLLGFAVWSVLARRPHGGPRTRTWPQHEPEPP